MKRTIVAHVQNVPGVLARVDGLFRRHGLPVESLHFDAAGPGPARLTVVARASADAAGLVVRQLRRFVDVRDAHEAAHDPSHENVARLRPAG
ncbi:MAG TPA: ACT domain-containing protein [Thermoanaerobaculia bacterium]|nr:ACT domain-containing protein [Thermoanaerobaculia bacterium]HQR67864.1 ACT domain-containing protein [Thermoanaerobaculia bacterium]